MYKLEQFAIHLNTKFLTSSDESNLSELVLIEASSLKQSGSSCGGSFSLLFQLLGGGYLEQRMYTLEHDLMGVFDVFLVPQSPENGMCRLEAVFLG